MSSDKTMCGIRGRLKIYGSKVVLKILTGFEELLSGYKNNSFDIILYTNRTTFQLQHLALQLLKEHELFELLFKNPLYLKFPNEKPACSAPSAIDCTSIELNAEQKRAVINIVEAKNKPMPFILFGPPGNYSNFYSSNKKEFS